MTEFRGQRYYLGKWGSAESKAKFREFVNRITKSRPTDIVAPPKGWQPTFAELAVSYLEWSKSYYGRESSEHGHFRAIFKLCAESHGEKYLDDFGPLALKAVRQKMVEAGWSRPYVNHQVQRIVRLFRWAASNEFCGPEIHLALKTVAGLRSGKTTAPDRPPVLPVDDATIEATLPFLPPVVADMVRLHRLTGCRPDELCRIRPCDVDRSQDVWVYRLAKHKTTYRGRERCVFIGPKAQVVLLPYLNRAPEAFCFSPAESEQTRSVERRRARKTKVQPSQQSRAKRFPAKQPGERYDSRSYAHAIRRACSKAFKESGKTWSPNQLRHAAATEIRRQFGLEAAQVVLGHSRADVTQIYAERDLSLGAKIDSAIG